MQESTIAAIATAPGAGGIAVVRLSGAESYTVAARVFRPKNPAKRVQDAKGYTALFGDFVRRTGGQEEAFDEGVALFFRAPHSYTGEDVVELSCHGGSAVAQLLVEACVEAGAQPAAPGEYTRRAYLNGKLSLTQAEAVMDLISAEGRQGAALANAALGGALAHKIAKQEEALTSLQAHLAAWVDFPEEDVPELEQDRLRQTLQDVRQELDVLIQGYGAGAVLREGVDCAIVGRPNAGKSTLLNLLAGFDRAIVTPVAGTTRDVVEQAVQLGDVRLNLFDTAGVRQTEDLIEAEGIRRSWQKLDEAGLVIAVFDGAQPLDREDLELARRCAGRPALALINKEDLETVFDAEIIAPYFSIVLPVCCKEERARNVIAAAVTRILGTNRIDPHAASLSGKRQLAAATRAREAVQGALEAVESGFGLDAVSVCVDDALDALYSLTGENASEAVINEVFERFCVGK
jgi:tRNA modification GTPase